MAIVSVSTQLPCLYLRLKGLERMQKTHQTKLLNTHSSLIKTLNWNLNAGFGSTLKKKPKEAGTAL